LFLFLKTVKFVKKEIMSATIKFPLNEVQISLLKLTKNLSEADIKILKKMIIVFKAQQLAAIADKVWEEKGWSEETMQTFLNTHMRTFYSENQV